MARNHIIRMIELPGEMTRQYAAKRRLIVASVVNTRVSVVSRVRVDPMDRSRKFMTAMAKPGE
jgi:hypothetical protein